MTNKIQITLKAPDAVFYALEEWKEMKERTDDEISEAESAIEEYFQYGELVTIEIEIPTRKATILKR